MPSRAVEAVSTPSLLSAGIRTYSPTLDAVMAPATALSSWVAALALAFLGRTALVSGWATPPNATTLNGTYVGVYNAEYGQDFFLGVPYAQPPLGALRFANPRSLNTSFDGLRDAKEYSDECVGYGVSIGPFILRRIRTLPKHGQSDQWGYAVNEDCLYVNVIRPANYSSYGEPLPVGVWIHVSSRPGIMRRRVVDYWLRAAASSKAVLLICVTTCLSSCRTASKSTSRSSACPSTTGSLLGEQSIRRDEIGG